MASTSSVKTRDGKKPKVAKFLNAGKMHSRFPFLSLRGTVSIQVLKARRAKLRGHTGTHTCVREKVKHGLGYPCLKRNEQTSKGSLATSIAFQVQLKAPGSSQGGHMTSSKSTCWMVFGRSGLWTNQTRTLHLSVGIEPCDILLPLQASRDSPNGRTRVPSGSPQLTRIGSQLLASCSTKWA